MKWVTASADTYTARKEGRPTRVVVMVNRDLKSGKLDQIDITPEDALVLVGKLVDAIRIANDQRYNP